MFVAVQNGNNSLLIEEWIRPALWIQCTTLCACQNISNPQKHTKRSDKGGTRQGDADKATVGEEVFNSGFRDRRLFLRNDNWTDATQAVWEVSQACPRDAVL